MTKSCIVGEIIGGNNPHLISATELHSYLDNSADGSAFTANADVCATARESHDNTLCKTAKLRRFHYCPYCGKAVIWSDFSPKKPYSIRAN